jgi:diaminopimelate decarboxylase
MKANNNSHILRLLQECGVPNVDVVSPGEIYKALNCGYKPHQILYTENFICEEELDYALKEGVVLNIGALETLKRFKNKLRHK